MTRSIALLLLFWIIAALLVAALPGALPPVSSATMVVAKIAAIVMVAFGYVKASRRLGSLSEALLAGVAWLLFDIVAEIAVTTRTGHTWFGLIGSPETPALRTIVGLAWIAAPAVFVQRSRQSGQDPSLSG